MAITKPSVEETIAPVVAPVVEAAQNFMERIPVIIQRPAGVTDSHIFIGFNDFEGQFKYDTPVMLPRACVEYLRQQTVVGYRPSESGLPVASYAKAHNIIDVQPA